MKRLSVVLLVLAIALLATGCSGVSDLSYETTADNDALAALHGGTLALLRFDADGVALRAEQMDEDIAGEIGEEHKAAFIEAMAPHFDIIDLTDEDIGVEGERPGRMTQSRFRPFSMRLTPTARYCCGTGTATS